ncbi:glutamyl-tRNA amidotransferase [Aurantiacibacter suaedae]|nr:glutamyl-tRNA amidotransferase [Aurantiacibacter suaedae]
MNNGWADLIAGIAIVLAIPAVFWFAGYIRKRVPHGEARFDENGKLIDDE